MNSMYRILYESIVIDIVEFIDKMDKLIANLGNGKNKNSSKTTAKSLTSNTGGF